MVPAPHRPRPRLASILLAFALLFAGCGEVQVDSAKSVSTLAGAPGGAGYFDGSPADPVRFDSPSGVAVLGTDRYVVDRENHLIRKIDAAGNVSTFAGRFGVAGSADGTGTAARFRSPSGIAAVGNLLYVADTGNHTIRRIVASSGVVTTLAGSPGIPGAADGTGSSARFSSPTGIATDGVTLGTTLYVADTGNHTVRRVTDAGVTTTFAGLAGSSGAADGLDNAARFSSPMGIALIGTSLIFVADTGNHTIRKIVPAGPVGDVTTLAGSAGTPGDTDGTGAAARFRSPAGIASDGSTLFVCDTGNHTVRNVTQAGAVTTLAGSPGVAGFADGTGSAARFDAPEGIGLIGGGSALLVVADTGNHVVRQLTAGGTTTLLAGNPPQDGETDGIGSAARFSGPSGIAQIGDDLYVADANNHTIRRIAPDGTVTTFAGLAGTPGTSDGTGTAARFSGPGGVAALGGDLYVADTDNHTIRKITGTGVVTTIAGSPGAAGSADGTGTAARFSGPRGIVALGGDLYVADTGNHTVRKVTPGGTVTTLAGLAGTPGSADGTGGLGGTARFDGPRGIAAIGTFLYVSDTANHTVRKVATPSGATTTYAGSAGQAGFTDDRGSAARFSSPEGLAAVGSVLFVADRGNHAVRRIGSTRTVTTFAGRSDAATTRDGDAAGALFNAPSGIAGVEGTLSVTDAREHVVRRILF
ncbi:MAG: hypothetical protein Kow00128_00880 [Deltaproteobacteria bacterium]